MSNRRSTDLAEWDGEDEIRLGSKTSDVESGDGGQQTFVLCLVERCVTTYLVRFCPTDAGNSRRRVKKHKNRT